MGKSVDLSMPRPPKKPTTIYFLYRNDVLESTHRQFPEASPAEVQAIITERWMNIDEKIRDAYVERYEQIRQRYFQEKKQYQALYGKKTREYRKRKLRKNLTAEQEHLFADVKKSAAHRHNL